MPQVCSLLVSVLRVQCLALQGSAPLQEEGDAGRAAGFR